MTHFTQGTTLSYNGVCLQDCEMLEFDHRSHSDESGTLVYDIIRFTVSSLIFPNNSTLEGTTVHSWNDSDPDDLTRVHQSQVVMNIGFNNFASNNNSMDQMQKLHSLLNTPMQDLVLWLNDVTDNTSDGTTKPQGVAVRTSPRRILLAATGTPGNSDYSTGKTTTRSDKLSVYDPQVNKTALTEIDVFRRQVLDCNLGPKSECVIEPLAGSRVFRVRATFEVCRPVLSLAITPANSGANPSVEDSYRLSSDIVKRAVGCIQNRWSVTDSLDDDGAVTHTIAGKLVVSDLRYKPNAMRLMAFPLAFPFARLAGREYVVSEDGKTLAYNFRFTHAGAAPPHGVRRYRARYQEAHAFDLKGYFRGMMDITVKGWHHRSSDNPAVTITEQEQKKILLRQLHTILFARIRGITQAQAALPGQVPGKVILTRMEILEEVGLPQLDMRVEVMYPGSDGGGSWNDYLLRLANLGLPFYNGAFVPQQFGQYDVRWWPIDNEWGRLLHEDTSNFFQDYAPLDIPQTADARTKADYFPTQPVEHARTGRVPTAVPHITKLPFAQVFEARGESGRDYDRTVLSGTRGPEPTLEDTPADVTTNPLKCSVFSAIPAVALNGTTISASQGPTQISADKIPFSLDQTTGNYAYLSWESEVLNNADTGIIALPLSKPRAIGGTAASHALETQTMIRLHAGKGYRVFSVKAERINDWPDIPAPAEEIKRTDAVGNNPGGPLPPGQSNQYTSFDTLISKEIIHDAPQPNGTGNCVVYTTNMRLTYACSRPWSPTAIQAGTNVDDLFPVNANRIMKPSSPLISPKSTDIFVDPFFA